MNVRPSQRAPRFLRRISSAVLVSVLLVEIVPLRAARADDQKERVQAVEDLTNRAYELVSAGKYSEAIGAYMKAFDISNAGAILFNIATIYDRKLHERALAMEYFRRYLQATDADPEFARKATERLSALKAEEAAEAQVRASVRVSPSPSSGAPALAAAPAAAPSRAASSDGAGLRRAGLVIGGVGLVGVGAGLVLGMLAKSKNDDANHYCDATSCFSDQGVTFEHQAGSLATASTVAFIAGASVLVLGATLFLAAPRGDGASSASITVSPQVSAMGGGAQLRATF